MDSSSETDSSSGDTSVTRNDIAQSSIRDTDSEVDVERDTPGIDSNSKGKLARNAFHSGDAYASKIVHKSAKSHLQKEKHKRGADYLKSAVYGGMDGIITTFAVVAGAAGAGLGTSIILIMGFSNLIADGISMGMGDFISSRAELDFIDSEQRRETWEFENYPKGEMDEMIEIYETKGLTRQDSVDLVEVLARHKKNFIETMMVEELGLLPYDPDESPAKHGAVTFLAFIVCGLVPLLSYVIADAAAGANSSFDLLFGIACALTAIALFSLGAVTSRFTIHPFWKTGLFTLMNGSIAAGLSYLVGWLVNTLVDDESG